MARNQMIASLYAAAAEPDALERMAYALRSYFDVDSAGVWMLDQGRITDLTVTADIAESSGPYLDYYRTLDPWLVAPKTPGEVYLSTDSVDERAFVRTEFYQDFARPFGMLRPMGLVVSLEPGVLGTVSLNRTASHRLFGETERKLFQDLAVHLQAALALRSRIAAHREVATASAQGDLLGSLSFPAAISDAALRLVALNDAFAALLAGGALLHQHGVLALATPKGTANLHALVYAAATSGEPGAMRIPDGLNFLSALITPMTADTRGQVLISIRSDADSASASDLPARLRRLFRLSPAQAELCVLLLAGRTFEEAAAARGITVSTARSHFLSILHRTGARNLRDLLRLLGSLPQTR